MDISNLASGLIGSVVGAAAAFVGALYLTHRAARDRRRGVVTALLGELLMNSSRAVAVVAGRVSEGVAAYSTSVWDEAKFEIAQFASRRLFAKLLGVYGSAEVASLATKQLQSGDSSYEQVIRLWYGAIRAAYNTLLKESAVRDATSGWIPLDSFESALSDFRRSAAGGFQPTLGR